MENELSALVRWIVTLTIAIFGLVAIRRVLIDLQDILGIRIRVEKKRSKLAPKRERHLQSINELTRPLQFFGGLSLGVMSQAKGWNAVGGKTATLQAVARDRNPHTLVLGSSNSGKSAYLASLIQQDILYNDRAVVVLDSSGDLVTSLVEWMATHKSGEKFAARTIVLEPDNPNCKLGFNPLLIDGDKNISTISAAVVRAFQSLGELPGAQSQFNPQTANILRNSVMLLAANGKSLDNLHTLLCDNDFRDILLESVAKRKSESSEYSLLLDTWQQYKKLMRTDQWIVWVEPILNRIGAATAHKGIVEILTRTSDNIDLREVVSEKQILLVKFDSTTDPKLLSSLLVAGLMDAATHSDARIENKLTALYTDQLDAVLTKTSFEALTTETNKNQIGVVGTLQNLHNLPETFRELLFTTAGRFLCFEVSRKDAMLLGPTMFRDCDEPEDSEASEQSVYERLLSLQPYEFYFCSADKVGAFKIQANKPASIGDAKVDRALMQRIMSNNMNADKTTS